MVNDMIKNESLQCLKYYLLTQSIVLFYDETHQHESGIYNYFHQ